ncbi:MAG: Cys-tRNA(Pro) deacylase [Christensenellales bacterium]|jgi:Cys-tRNA(Pro)/Cys-tRNA(Cys) deacylase
MASIKTNAMRFLDSAGVSYRQHTYESDGFLDGVAVAKKIGQPKEKVFKTLVAQGTSRAYYVFVIPAAKALDLKAAARAVGEKSVGMIKAADITKVTGYIRGGCSPIGMKKAYKTVIDVSCAKQYTIIFSAGKIGCQIEMRPDDLINIIHCKIENIVL